MSPLEFRRWLKPIVTLRTRFLSAISVASLVWSVVLPGIASTSFASRAQATEVAAYRPTEQAESEVATWRGDWIDAARHRTVPVKIYFPENSDGKRCPVIVFSHGLGGSRDGYGYLGKYWAAHGYISVHLQHHGSDEDVMAGALRPRKKIQKLREAAANPANFSDRPNDVRFTLDQLALLDRDENFPLHGRIDLDAIAVAGHSFGAYTVMAVSGQWIGPDRALRSFGPDPRIKSAIAMSSQPAHTANLDDAYSRISIPIFHLTGTKDQLGRGHNSADPDAIVGNATAADRRVAYDHTRHAPAYLLTFRDGDHMVFSGRGRMTGGAHDQEYQRIICIASTAFWDATLRHDDAARRWLEESGGLAALLGDAGTFEQKHP